MGFTVIGSIINKVAEKNVEFVFVIGLNSKYIKTAKRITKFSNLIQANIYTAEMLLKISGRKYAKYSPFCSV